MLAASHVRVCTRHVCTSCVYSDARPRARVNVCAWSRGLCVCRACSWRCTYTCPRVIHATSLFFFSERVQYRLHLPAPRPFTLNTCRVQYETSPMRASPRVSRTHSPSHCLSALPVCHPLPACLSCALSHTVRGPPCACASFALSHTPLRLPLALPRARLLHRLSVLCLCCASLASLTSTKTSASRAGGRSGLWTSPLGAPPLESSHSLASGFPPRTPRPLSSCPPPASLRALLLPLRG